MTGSLRPPSPHRFSGCARSCCCGWESGRSFEADSVCSAPPILSFSGPDRAPGSEHHLKRLPRPRCWTVRKVRYRRAKAIGCRPFRYEHLLIRPSCGRFSGLRCPRTPDIGSGRFGLWNRAASRRAALELRSLKSCVAMSPVIGLHTPQSGKLSSLPMQLGSAPRPGPYR